MESFKDNSIIEEDQLYLAQLRKESKPWIDDKQWDDLVAACGGAQSCPSLLFVAELRLKCQELEPKSYYELEEAHEDEEDEMDEMEFLHWSYLQDEAESFCLVEQDDSLDCGGE